MGGKDRSTSAVDYSDIQGLVRFGYGALFEACFLLLNIRDARAARAWLLTAPVTTAEELSQPPKTALQVAFTREGLQALGVADDVLAGFSAEFLSGMATEESRSRRLGDVGGNSPQYWQWGGANKVPHMRRHALCPTGAVSITWKQTVQCSRVE